MTAGHGWSAGYVVDVAYTDLAFSELMLGSLSLVSVLNGQPPIDVSRPLTYVELGCGNGLSTCMVAASCPQLDVYGYDFNPVHIERARDLARRAGLANAHFEEVSFETLAADRSVGPAVADVVVMHGVYGWVNDELRRSILTILRDRLTPGGLVYVSYNLQPGWAGLLPVREVIRAQAASDPRRSDLAARAGLATVAQLEADEAAIFPLPMAAAAPLAHARDADPAYVAHEYLAGDCAPMSFDAVAGEMAVAKLRFVGSATAVDHDAELRCGAELGALVETLTSQALRQTVADIATSAAFRRDVFRRGLLPALPGERAVWYDEVVVTGRGRSLDAENLVISTPGSTVTVPTATLRQVLDDVNANPRSMLEMRRRPYGTAWDERDLRRIVALLVQANLVTIGLRSAMTDASADACARLNRVLIEGARQGRPLTSLAAPGGIGPVAIDQSVALALGELWDGCAPRVDALAEALVARGRATGVTFADGLELSDETARARLGVLAGHTLADAAGPLAVLGIRAPSVRGRPSRKSSR